MKNKNEKKKKNFAAYIGIAVCMLIGFLVGVLGAEFLIAAENSTGTVHETLPAMAAMFVSIYIGYFIHIVLHELGHLVFGLLSGYKFNSFRIASFIWIKNKNGVKLKRFSMAGTGGQCLMSPPKSVNGRVPTMLYNFGGAIMNIIFGSVFLVLFFVFLSVPYLSIVLIMFAVVGLAAAIINGLPLKVGGICNDGYNAFFIRKNPDAEKAFCTQLKINGESTNGVRLKDMPKEWFEMPSDEALKNHLVATIGVFACNRLMDEHKIEQAYEAMNHLLSIESGVIGIHRSLLVCDCIFAEIVTQNRHDVIEDMLTKEQLKMMKNLKTLLSVIRTEYAIALVYENDAAKADKLLQQFEKLAKSSPYQSDIESEREMINIVKEKFQNK